MLVMQRLITADENLINKFVSRAKHALDNTMPIKSSENIKKGIESLEIRKNKVIDLMVDGTISKEEYQTRIDDINKRIEDYQKELNDITLITDKQNTLKSKLEIIKEIISNKLTIDEFDEDVLEALIKKVVVGHNHSEAVKENDVPETCESDGHYDMVVYCSKCGAEISRTTHIVNKLGHNYGEVTYIWNGDKCTATRICQNDNTHVETETVTGTYVKVSDATCTLNETGKYTATFENALFEAQESEVFEVTDSKLGHSYGEPEFVWDGYTAKAIFICTNDESHKEEIQAVITNAITKESTVEETGIKTYTAINDKKS